MKKQIVWAAGLLGLFSFTACNNGGNGTATTDSTNTNTSSSTTSTNNYSAFADSVERNSNAGYYLDPKSGKAIRMKVDRSTGAVTNYENNTPVRRYVDNRTWWVYGGDKWDTIGMARKENDRLEFRDMNNHWVSYDKRWTDDTMSTGNNMNGNMNNMNSDSSSTMNNSGGSMDNNSNGKTKTKTVDKGDKMKTKQKSKD